MNQAEFWKQHYESTRKNRKHLVLLLERICREAAWGSSYYRHPDERGRYFMLFRDGSALMWDQHLEPHAESIIPDDKDVPRTLTVITQLKDLLA